MGMLKSLLGGVVGFEMASVVHNLVEKHGGLQGIVTQLQQNGLGNTVKSWISTGPNQPVTGDQLHQALGADTIKDLAAKAGMEAKDLLNKLATALPAAVDHLTPGGQMPKA